MSLVHYKFKSSLDYQHVKFDGLHISVGDLKKEIVAQKNLRLGDFELEIANAQTGSVYRNNSTLIPRNASVVVYRVPAKPCAASSTQKSWEAYKQEAAKAREQQKQLSLEQLKQTADLANANASEIDKVIAAVAQSNKGFEPSSYVGRHHTGPVSDGYICNRCQQTGHYVANCPNKAEVLAPHIKRTTGIPNSFLTYVDDPLAPGALLTHHGHFAVPTIDAQAYREGKKERPPFLPQPKTTGMEKPAIPVELKCGLCQDLLTDAVVIPCCGNSYCDECIRDALLETEGHQCPTCGQYDVSPNGIISNNSLRSAVTAFTNDSGYSKARRKSADGRAPVSQQRQPPQQSVQHHNPPQHHKPVHPQHNQMSPSNPQHNQMSPSNPQPPPPHRNAPPQEHPRPPRHPQSLPSHLQGPHHSLHQPRPRRLTSKASPRSRPHMEGGLPHDPSHMSPDSPLLPTPHASSSGHQLHGGLVLRPNVPPAVSHHHHPPGFPDQRRVEAPPVYVSSTLTAADSNSRYSPRGAYEEDGSEQDFHRVHSLVIAVVGSQAQPVRGRGGGLRGLGGRGAAAHQPPIAAGTYPTVQAGVPLPGAGAVVPVYPPPPYQAISIPPPGYAYPAVLASSVYQPAVYPAYAPSVVPVPASQKRDIFEDFAKDIMEKKPERRRDSRSRSRGRSFTPRRSRTRSRSRSRSFKGRSRSRSPRRSRLRSYSRGRSLTPPRSSSRSRGSPGQKARSPGRDRSRTPGNGKPRSVCIRRSRSAGRRPRSPARRSRSPGRRSRSPGRRSRSPVRRSRSPGGKFRSPGKGSIRSPESKYKSPIRGRSKSPVRGRSKSPVRGRSKSPVRGRSKSLGRGRSKSPGRGRSKSPGRGRSKSPVRGRSKSPIRGRSKSPIRGRSKSPNRQMRSPSRRRSRTPRSLTPRRRSRSFSPRRYRGSYSRSRSRDSPRRSRTHSRSWSSPRRCSYSVSPLRITTPLQPVARRSASPFRRRSASPGFRRKGRTPPPAAFHMFRGRGRGRGRARGHRGDWVAPQHRQFNDARRPIAGQFSQNIPPEDYLRFTAQRIDAYYRDYYAKFGPNAAAPPPPGQWNQHQIFPDARGGHHFPLRPALLGWQHQEQLQAPQQQPQLQHPSADVRRDLDREHHSVEPQPPGVDQLPERKEVLPNNRRDFPRDGQKDFSREFPRDYGRDFTREQNREGRDQMADHGRNFQSRDLRDQNVDYPRDYPREQGRDQSRDYIREQGRDQSRDYIREQGREQSRDYVRDQRRDYSRDYRENRDYPRDHWRDRDYHRDNRDSHRGHSREGERENSRDHHSKTERDSQEKNRRTSEKYTKDKKKKMDKENVVDKDKVPSKKKVVKRSSSVEDKLIPAKKVKKVKTEVGIDEKVAVVKNKVLKKKKKVAPLEKKAAATDLDAPLSSNLIQVTITKDEKSDSAKPDTLNKKDNASKGTKKVIRKVKKLKPKPTGVKEKKEDNPPKAIDTKVKVALVKEEVAGDLGEVITEVSDSLPGVKTEGATSPRPTEDGENPTVNQEVVEDLAGGDTEVKAPKALGSTDDELMLHPPELSKWEREDYDWDTTDLLHPARKRGMPSEKSITMLPRSVLNRAETYMAKKPVKPTVASATSSSPMKPQRRVILEEKADVKNEDKEERRVKATRTSSLDMQITVTKSEKRSPSQQERSVSHDRHSRVDEDTRSVKKARETEEDRSYQRRRVEERTHSTNSVRNRRDSVSPRRDNDRDRHPYDRRDREEPHRAVRERDEHHRTREDHRREREDHYRDREQQNREEERYKERKTNTVEKSSSSAVPKDLRHKLEQNRSKDGLKKTQRTIDRKESVIDESKFEPDYEEMEESSNSGSDDVGAEVEQQSTVSTEETSDIEASSAKKAQVDSEEGGKKKHKKSRHKKNKKQSKHKKSKKRKKEKKHKKDKEEKDE